MSSITTWSEADRPREKMLDKGIAALTDSELLAILIGSGTVGQSAVGLAQEILTDAEQSLHALGRKSIKELQKHKGIGAAKAIAIAAALEIGRRRQLADLRHRHRIHCSRDAYEAIGPMLAELAHEEFWILMLNNASEVTDRKCISTGGMTGTIVDVRKVFGLALESNAAAIVAVHNHPSGNLQPSAADLKLTQKLVEAGTIMDVRLLDHLIVSERGYYSFKDEGRVD